MGTDNSSHRRHTAVTNFNIVSIEQLMVFVVLGEMLVYEL